MKKAHILPAPNPAPNPAHDPVAVAVPSFWKYGRAQTVDAIDTMDAIGDFDAMGGMDVDF